MPAEGTYQLWMDFRGLGMEKKALDDLVFNKAGLGLAPGDWFGQDGSGFYRMTIASPKKKLIEVFEKLKSAYDSQV